MQERMKEHDRDMRLARTQNSAVAAAMERNQIY